MSSLVVSTIVVDENWSSIKGQEEDEKNLERFPMRIREKMGRKLRNTVISEIRLNKSLIP